MSTIMYDQTERQPKDEQMRLLDYAFNCVDEAIFLIDSRAQFLQVNEKACLSLGYSREELLSMSVFDIDPDFNQECWQQLQTEYESGKKSITLETRHRRKDGLIFPIEVCGHYIVYQGQYYNLAMVRDITERKTAEKQLTLLNYALNHIKEEVWLIDENAKFHYINRAACDSIGCSHQEILQLSVPDIKPDYGFEQWKEDWQRTKTTGSFTFITHHKSNKGDIFPVEVNASYFELDGQGYTLAFSHDITEQQHVEETLKFVAQRGWKDRNESFLVALTQYLAQLFKVDYVIIDKIGTSSTQAETIALCVKGAIVPNMQYELQGTPCADVMNGKLCCYPEKVQQLFPDDALLVEMQAESYAGLPLWDTTGNVIGLIAILDSKPLHNPDFISAILQLVATSAAAELERQHSEQRLLDSHHFLAQIINTLVDPVFVKDRAHRWVLLNQAYCGFMGCTLKQLLGKSDYDFFPAHQADIFWAKDEAVFSSGEENINEEEFTDADGVCRTILTKKRGFTDSTGQQFLVGIITDITERKKMEQILRQREQEFRVLVETSPSPIIRYDAQCRRTYVNPAVEKMAGKTAAEMLAHVPTEGTLLGEPIKNEIERLLRHVLKTGQMTESEVELVLADGQTHYFYNRYAPELDANGKAVGVVLVGHDITARKQAEQLLAQREQEFRSLAENMPDNLIRYDLHARVCYLNPAIKRSLAPEFLPNLNQTLSESFPGNVEVVKAQRVIEQVIATREIVHIEVCVPNPEGEICTHALRYVPEYDYQGNLIGVLAIGRDVTERKRMEEELAAREQQFRVLAESLPSPVFRFDKNCYRTYVNPAAERISGIAAEELLYRKASDASPLNKEELIKVEQILEQVLKTGKPQESEVLFKVPSSGRIYYFYTRYAPEFDANGETNGVIAISHDITERKRMEDELAAREREFRILVETSSAPIFRYDTDCRRIYVNPAVEQMTGKPAAELLNRVPSDASILSKQQGEKLENALRQVIRTGQAVEGEIECVAADGETRYYYNRYAPELDADGKVLSVILVALDITERKRAEQLLHQREQEFRALVNNLPSVVLRYNRHLQRIYANPAYLQLMGKTEADVLNKSLEDTWVATNMSAADYKAVLTQVMRDGEKQEVLLEWTDGNGELICHALKIVPEYAIDGQVQSVLALGFDFSEQRRQQLIETNRQQVFEKMARNNSLDAILKQVALYIESAKAGRYCGILLTDETGGDLELVVAPSFPASFLAKNAKLDHQNCPGWAAAALSKNRVILDNLQNHSCTWLCRDFIEETQTLACWSEPIISSANQLLGVVVLYLNQAGSPDDNDAAHLLRAAHLSAIAIERKRIEQQMQHQASYDVLTGLPNRRLFHNRLQEEIYKAERSGHPLAVLFIDLDHFKDVNDTLGHEIGDRLLVDAASRIQNCVRKSDTVARLGGDEFVAILPELGKVPPVARIAEAIIKAMALPFKLGDYQTYVSASVGIAMYPQDARHADTLVGYADQAMYAAKEAGRSSFNFFTHSMQEQAQQRLYLVNSLRDALEKNQFEVYYQPIIEVSSGKAVKAEALLRWRHPALGNISPTVFIPLAEETDLIQDIGSWVFRQAADMVKRWHSLGDVGSLCKVSINMSPRQLMKGCGDQMAIDYLQAIALDSNHIVIEITEGLLLDDSPDITEKLERLRTQGIQLSLDDFGTGYSAMAYLKKFDINYLKIDRSFVGELETNADDRAITEAIVMMAHRLGLKVIAEGVETAGQHALLAAVGCEYIQGFFYAEPMPMDAFLSYVADVR